MTVGEMCTPARELRHEIHPATTTIMDRRGLWEDPNSREAYKKVTNESKMVKLFEIITENKEFSIER